MGKEARKKCRPFVASPRIFYSAVRATSRTSLPTNLDTSVGLNPLTGLRLGDYHINQLNYRPVKGTFAKAERLTL